MPRPKDFSNINAPPGPVRGAQVIVVQAGDHVDERGFLVQGAGATYTGNLVCVPMLEGSQDFTLEVTSADNEPVFMLGGMPVLCRAVRGTGATPPSTAARFTKVYP